MDNKDKYASKLRDKGWSEEDIKEELEGFTDEQINKGYDIFDFDGTGMLEILRLDTLGKFENDEEAVSQAIKDGVKIIPVDELPQNFDRRYLGWIDTQENRQAINAYCKELQTEIDIPKELYGNDEIAQKYFSKFLNGEPFSEEEIKNILMSYTISEIEGEAGYWSQPITSIVELCGHTFQIDWEIGYKVFRTEIGFSETQNDEYPNQPFEVIGHTKTITDWSPVVPKSINPEHMSPDCGENNEEETEEPEDFLV